MSRTRLVQIMLLVLTFVIAAVVAAARIQPVSRNPFETYRQFMPGQSIPAGACESNAAYWSNAIYLTCKLDDPAFSTITLALEDYRSISATYFYPRSLFSGDLVLWLGTPKSVRRLGRSWIFYWQNAGAYTRRSGNRYTAKVVSIWFRGGE
jgi:hypothetical protein